MAASDTREENTEDQRVGMSTNSVQEPSAEVAEISHIWIEDTAQETDHDVSVSSDSPGTDGVTVGSDGLDTTNSEQKDTPGTDSDGSIGTTETMLRTSPEGSPASPRSSSPVVKRVHFLDSFDTDDDGLPAVHTDAKNYRKADTQWHDKDNRVKPLKSALKESENIFMLETNFEKPSGSNAEEDTNIGNGSVTQHTDTKQSRWGHSAFPPAPSGKVDYRRSRGCQWGCCCAFGWFMIGAIALSAGAVLVAYMRGYWLAQQNSFERSLLYFGAALCAIGGVSLLVGLGFFTYVSLICNPKRAKSENQEATVDSTKSRYVIKNDSMGFEAVGGKGIQHISVPSDITVVNTNTGYVPCVEYNDSPRSIKESRGHI